MARQSIADEIQQRLTRLAREEGIGYSIDPMRPSRWSEARDDLVKIVEREVAAALTQGGET